MATSELARPEALWRDTAQARETPQISAARYCAIQALHLLASLKLTVALFTLSIFLVFAGTLAQVDNDVWHVVNDTYFRVWIAEVDFLAFERLGQMFYKPFSLGLPEGLSFPFPGGKIIGLLLLVNLTAAHAIRFRIAASGARVWSGLAIIAAGLVVTFLVIRSGMDQAIESELTPAFANGLWQALRATLAGVVLVGVHLLVATYHRMRAAEWYTLLAIELALAALAVWLLVNPDARLDNSGLRILWQLVKGTAAGVILLVGCVMAFRRRAGIVLLHGGVALMMLSELVTAMGAHESQMTIPEGGVSNWSQDIRTAELAVIDSSDEKVDRVTVIPQSLLTRNVGKGERIEHPALPFDIQIHQWLYNSKLADPADGKSNPATAGFGTQRIAEEVAGATGVDTNGKVDIPSAYLELFAKETGESLGTYLVSQHLYEQPVEVDGKIFDIALRFQRTYYPFSVALKDFRFDKYVGTNTPKNYSSDVIVRDPERNVERDIRISMNNPLRYAGYTFYQSSFDDVTEATTVLQVMKNPGWMAPYVACMLVAIGMLAHFGSMLVRFLQRRSEESRVGTAHEQPRTTAGTAHPASARATFARWFPALVVLLFGGYLVSKARVPEAKPGEMRVHEFGQLPVQYQGRVKPYDTLARNSLQFLSGRQEVIGPQKPGWINKLMRRHEKTPAIIWLLDTISGAAVADAHPVFRIENLELLETLGLEPREGSFRYSLNDFRSELGELDKQIRLAAGLEENQLSLYQRKVLELAKKLQFYGLLRQSFAPPQLRMDREKLLEDLQMAQADIQRLREAQMPLSVPPTTADVHWTVLMEAELRSLVARALNQPVGEGAEQLRAILNAYAEGDTTTFNRELAAYRRTLAGYERTLTENERQLSAADVKHAEVLSQSRVDFEVFFNHASPFYYAAALYLVAFMLGAASWLGWSKPLRQASMWLLYFTFIVHTLALIARIYISGRPPVTNLYSSAVFIGWACVLIALVMEWIYRLGLGNIVAAVIGFLTLVVAHYLSLDGDTLIVMQAVLDTQFWLATHVVCITLGYSTTFLAGMLGVLYVLFAHVFPVMSEPDRRQLTRMTYGTLCFAIFFSFVGTVLGGLWADDSWGRFWGWDPKENGALIIVLYNALVLHARWGGMVKGRGLATLAVGGNIVTAWSWFGVNELGVGLHAYGASESTTAMWLLTFAVSQMIVMALGIMPSSWYNAIGIKRPAAAMQ